MSKATRTPRIGQPNLPDTLAGAHDCLLLDLDGTVFRGSEPTPNAIAALSAAGDARQLYVTNNASRSAPAVADHLTSLGFAPCVMQPLSWHSVDQIGSPHAGAARPRATSGRVPDPREPRVEDLGARHRVARLRVRGREPQRRRRQERRARDQPAREFDRVDVRPDDACARPELLAFWRSGRLSRRPSDDERRFLMQF